MLKGSEDHRGRAAFEGGGLSGVVLREISGPYCLPGGLCTGEGRSRGRGEKVIANVKGYSTDAFPGPGRRLQIGIAGWTKASYVWGKRRSRKMKRLFINGVNGGFPGHLLERLFLQCKRNYGSHQKKSRVITAKQPV